MSNMVMEAEAVSETCFLNQKQDDWNLRMLITLT
jgi:hypothetical protein